VSTRNCSVGFYENARVIEPIRFPLNMGSHDVATHSSSNLTQDLHRSSVLTLGDVTGLGVA